VAAQNALAGRVFETPVLNNVSMYYSRFYRFFCCKDKMPNE